MNAGKFKLPVWILSPTVDPELLGFKDTSELEPLSEPSGKDVQSRPWCSGSRRKDS